MMLVQHASGTFDLQADVTSLTAQDCTENDCICLQKQPSMIMASDVKEAGSKSGKGCCKADCIIGGLSIAHIDVCN